MQGLTGLQRDLLVVLSGVERANGTQLKRELERSKYSSLLGGRVYYNLDTLVERSLVEKQSCDGRTNEYCLTREGYERLYDHYEWQRDYVESTSPREGLTPQ